MAVKVWFLIASLCLVTINGKPYKNGVKYFERAQEPESSSPAPQPAESSERKLTGTKELVLYLTPDQVKVLESAGAVVKPYPEFEKALVKPQSQQSVEEQTEPQPKEDANEESALEEFYKVLNVQKVKKTEEEESESAEEVTEKPRPKNKYSSKPRQQDYAALYVQKKANRGKPYSTEYVRFLPNYESENLKMESYRPRPVPGYRFAASPENLEIAKYILTEAPEIIKSNNNPQESEEIQSEEEDAEDTLPKEPVRIESQEESSEESESEEDDKGPVTFEGKVRDATKARKSSKIQQSAKTRQPAKVREPAKVQEEEDESKETQELSEEELVEALKSLAKEQGGRRPNKSSAEVERQLNSLLAPLIQHKKITDTIAKEKEELAKNEREIQNKLKELKESGNHDLDQYSIELQKLNENLRRQNALAEKLARQGITKPPKPEPQVTEKPEEEEEEEQQEVQEQEQEQEEEEEVIPKRRQPTESKKKEKTNDSTPVVIRIPDSLNKPELYPITLDYLRSIGIPTHKAKRIEEKPVPVEKRIRIPETGNVYVKIDKPYLVHQPDRYTILRHVWEH